MRVAFLGLVLLLPAPALGYGIAAGPASVTYDFANDGDCYPRVLAEACIASHDPGTGPGMGDDTFSQYRAFDAFEARLDPSFLTEAGAPWPLADAEVVVTQEALIFPTGLGQRLAEAADAVHAAMPGAYRENARLWFNEGGFIFEVRMPDPEALAGGRWDWTTSQNVVPLFVTNRTHTWVPLGIAPLDLDRGLDLARAMLTQCSFTYQTGGMGICPGLPAEPLFHALNDSLPQVALGAWVKQASVAAAAAPDASPGIAAAVEAASRHATAAQGPWQFPRASGLAPSPPASEGLAQSPAGPAERRAPAGSEPTAASLASATWPEAGWPPVLTLAGVALLAAWSLLTRLRREDVLRHAGRARLYAHLEAHPGCIVHHAARSVEVDYKTAQHHVRVLRDCGMVDAVERSRATHLFRSGHFTALEKAAIATLRTGSAAPLLGHVVVAPGIGLSDLARASGMSKAGVARLLFHLGRAGLVVQQRVGRERRLYPTELALRLGPLIHPKDPGEGFRGVSVVPDARGVCSPG